MRVWRYLYVFGAVWCVLGGYRAVLPGRIDDFAFGWSFIVAAFLFFCFMPLGITALQQRFGVEMLFRRPSLDRPPFGRGGDPMQVFRVFLVSSVLMSLGGGFAFSKADHRGEMLFWASVAMSTGLLLGERLIYRVYAKRIP